MKKPIYYVDSFSGGKDSTAKLLRMIELGYRIDEVICCDTYMEFPAMYRHIEKVRKVVEDAGIKFTILKNEKSFEELMFYKPIKRKNERYKGLLGFSWPGPRSRWCTAHLKTQIIDRYLRELRQKYEVIEYIGIAADEGYRLERKHNQNKNHRHPLVEWGWTEKDCLEYCYSLGYDWEGLYELFARVSCWCCPLQPLEELRKLRKHFPELWQKLLDMDRRTYRQFKAEYSVEELEIRFALEEERQAKGLTINGRSKEFREALKQRLNESKNMETYEQIHLYDLGLENPQNLKTITTD